MARTWAIPSLAAVPRSGYAKPANEFTRNCSPKFRFRAPGVDCAKTSRFQTRGSAFSASVALCALSCRPKATPTPLPENCHILPFLFPSQGVTCGVLKSVPVPCARVRARASFTTRTAPHPPILRVRRKENQELCSYCWDTTVPDFTRCARQKRRRRETQNRGQGPSPRICCFIYAL